MDASVANLTPQHWSPVPNGQTCPNIEGCYNNEGEHGASDFKFKPTLFYHLIPANDYLADPNASTNAPLGG